MTTRIEEAINFLVKAQKKSGKDHRICVSVAINHLVKHLAGKPLTVKLVGVNHDSDEDVCFKCGIRIRKKEKFQQGLCPYCEEKTTKSKDETVAIFLEENIVKHENRVQRDLKRLESERAKYSESNMKKVKK